MVKILSSIFLKGVDKTTEAGRRLYGMLCSLLGIGLNILLFAGKLTAGTLSGSIAITADAFNNLSDAGSSVITLIGFKFAGMKPDTKHPFGHGRIEYISGLVVSFIIVIVGFELLISSIQKIKTPEELAGNYPVTIIILVASILIKGYMFFYNHKVGKEIDSAGMKATAFDSISDCAATLVVLISVIISALTGANVDGWFGAAVSLFVLFAGFRSAIETIQPLLGNPPEEEFVKNVEATVMSHSVVLGIHDMIVHDYGPGRVMMSLHAEVDGKGDIYAIHDEIDVIENELRNKFGCEAVIHMDPIETDNEITNKYKDQVVELIKTIHKDATIHDFRMVPGPTHTNLIFDAVIPYEIKAAEENIKEDICKLIEENCKDCFAVVMIDRPYTTI
ncbi:MAG: cation transporter [Ruminococcaceae bacterium]|nr:cation transporter [Oscillospiraceae bacterium]